MSVVAQRYGYSVHYEVMNDRVGRAFSEATNEAKLRVAGAPRITQKEEAAEGQMAFDATFEVYPEVKIGDLSAAEVETATQRSHRRGDRSHDRHPAQAAPHLRAASGSRGALEGDRVTIDFEGKIDGEPFAGGKAEAFQFVIGEGQMLEQFDQAVRGMKVGESKTFPLQFPADYHGKDVAGKEADFLVTLKKIESAKLPAVDEAFAKSLGIKDGTVEALREDVRKNLEREVRQRVLARNKAAVMEALVNAAELDVPKALVAGELERLVAAARDDLKKRGVKDAETAPIPNDVFEPQAERRVRLGLVVGELVRPHNLQAKPDQLQAHIEELSQSYEKPAEVMRWYLSDRQRMAEVEAVVIENNVTEFVLAQGQGQRQGATVRRTDVGLTSHRVAGEVITAPRPRAARPGDIIGAHASHWPRRFMSALDTGSLGMVPDRHRTVGPRRARLRHLQPAAARAHRLPGRAGQRPDGQPGRRADAVPGEREPGQGHLPVHQLAGRQRQRRHVDLRHDAVRQARCLDDVHGHGREHGRVPADGRREGQAQRAAEFAHHDPPAFGRRAGPGHRHRDPGARDPEDARAAEPHPRRAHRAAARAHRRRHRARLLHVAAEAQDYGLIDQVLDRRG